jgi:hypothetical protein
MCGRGSFPKHRLSELAHELRGALDLRHNLLSFDCLAILGPQLAHHPPHALKLLRRQVSHARFAFSRSRIPISHSGHFHLSATSRFATRHFGQPGAASSNREDMRLLPLDLLRVIGEVGIQIVVPVQPKLDVQVRLRTHQLPADLRRPHIPRHLQPRVPSRQAPYLLQGTPDRILSTAPYPGPLVPNRDPDSGLDRLDAACPPDADLPTRLGRLWLPKVVPLSAHCCR